MLVVREHRAVPIAECDGWPPGTVLVCFTPGLPACDVLAVVCVSVRRLLVPGFAEMLSDRHLCANCYREQFGTE